MRRELADLPAGLADPVHDAQQVFRHLLDAMARPGRIVTLPSGLPSPPAGLSVAAAAVLLTVLDAEVQLWLAPSIDAADWLRFHTGARLAHSPATADWLVLRASEADADADAAPWHTAHPGTDEAPHTSATVLIDVDALDARGPVGLRGPGIEHRHTLGATGLGSAFWQRRREAEAAFPQGIDLILACDRRLAAVPRSTRIDLED